MFGTTFEAPSSIPQRSSTEQPGEPGTERRYVLILGALAALGPLSIDMYLPAFPSIARSFSVPTAAIETSVSIYFVGLAIGQLFYGPISDRYGRKIILVGGLSIYIVSAIWCAFASSIDQFLLARFLKSIGACSGIVISRAIVRDRFETEQTARIFSLLMLVMGVAPIVAPLMGGFIATYWDWHGIFWFLALFSLGILLAIKTKLPETHGGNPDVRLGTSFATYQGLLADKKFMTYTLSGSVAQAGMFAYITGSPYVFIEYFGIAQHNFGWLFGFNALGLITFAQLNTLLLKRYSYDDIIPVSLTVIAITSILLIASGWLELGFWWLVPPLWIYLAILGTTFPNTIAGALANQSHRAGSASALAGTLQMGLAATASAIVGNIHGTSAFALTAVVGGCGVTSLFIWRFMALRT